MQERGIFALFELSRDPRYQRKVMKEMIKGKNLQIKALSYSHLKIQFGPHPTQKKEKTQNHRHLVWLLNSTGITPLNIAYV